MNEKPVRTGTYAVDILLVDDEPNFLRNLAEELLHCADNFNIITTESASKAIDYLHNVMVDVVVMDLNMPGTDGLELLNSLQQLQKTYSGMKIIIMSSCAWSDVESKLTSLTFSRYFKKPFEPADMVHAILDTAQFARVA